MKYITDITFLLNLFLLIVISVYHCEGNVYCYSTDPIRPQNKHYSLQTAHPNVSTFKYEIEGKKI